MRKRKNHWKKRTVKPVVPAQFAKCEKRARDAEAKSAQYRNLLYSVMEACNKEYDQSRLNGGITIPFMESSVTPTPYDSGPLSEPRVKVERMDIIKLCYSMRFSLSRPKSYMTGHFKLTAAHALADWILKNDTFFRFGNPEDSPEYICECIVPVVDKGILR